MERKIELLPTDNLESAVYTLLAAKARGEHVYCVFNGYEFHSDTVTMDLAYKTVIGKTKAERDNEIKEENERVEREEIARAIREQGYAQKVNEFRKEKKPITSQEVIEGLKFIAEHQSISQDELIDSLLQLGCNFTFEEIQEQFPQAVNLFEGVKNGNIACGASIIVNARDSEFGRSFVNEKLLSVDDDSSIYHFVRVLTGDDTYTKENIDTLNNSGKRL